MSHINMAFWAVLGCNFKYVSSQPSQYVQDWMYDEIVCHPGLRQHMPQKCTQMFWKPYIICDLTRWRVWDLLQCSKTHLQRSCHPEEEGFFSPCKVSKWMSVCKWYMACCKQLYPLGSQKGPDRGRCVLYAVSHLHEALKRAFLTPDLSCPAPGPAFYKIHYSK